jgi:hypothetical protein
MKYLQTLLLLLGLTACSRNPNTLNLQCYGQKSLAIDNQLTDSQDAKQSYHFQNLSIPEHICTTAQQTIQCSRIKDEDGVNTNHYIILNSSLGTVYETTITIEKTKSGEKKTKEIFQGKCESPILN